MEKFEIVKAYENFKERLEQLNKVLNVEAMQVKINDYEAKMGESNFWDDQKAATALLQTTNDMKETLATYQKLCRDNDELETFILLDDESLFDETDELIKTLARDLEHFEVALLLNEEYDHLNAIMELHPGAGGTESQDWALMLYRMYKRYAERNNYEFELLDYQEANDAGVKSVTFLIKGKNTYGILKGEKGVHRLVRISPFDSNARRHTSFVACNVTPEIDNTINVEINTEDIKVDTYRSSGAGGQHINKTESAIRITHLPTGIVVNCQNQRSQIQNREFAMRVLMSKLHQLEQTRKQQELRNISGELTDNAFGSQIRSYVLHPYAMVKDHRTGAESSNPNNVLDGDLDLFINAYLKYHKQNSK